MYPMVSWLIIRIKPTYQSTWFYYIKQDRNGHWQRKQLHFHTIDAIIWKKDRNGHWQKKQLYFHTIDAIIWKKRQKRELAEETTLFPHNRCHYMEKKDRNGNWQRKLFHFNAINFIISWMFCYTIFHGQCIISRYFWLTISAD